VNERKRVTPHTLRHFFASELLHAGGSADPALQRPAFPARRGNKHSSAKSALTRFETKNCDSKNCDYLLVVMLYTHYVYKITLLV
jgi:integrase